MTDKNVSEKSLETETEKPCLVQTNQGFSVFYKQRFLYSKYSPKRVIMQTVENLEVMEGTVFLIFSPCLFYGMEELLKKLKENCIVIACEADDILYEFSKQYESKEVSFLSGEKLKKLPEHIFDIAQCGKYKRICRIDFSGGVQFFKAFYDNLELACKNSIETFWKNRITLIKFGRKYCTNFFLNLKKIFQTIPVESYFNKITKPIIVFGAGESIDRFLDDNLKTLQDFDFFIICADTALQPLIKRKIPVDAVFIEEAQSIILKAFIGTKNHDFHIFSALSSVHQIVNIFPPEKISFFTTKFANLDFFEKLKTKNCLPPENDPFGSVGITAVHYALKFRKDDSVPVFISGLDFSFSIGKTHAKGTLASTTRLFSANRIKNIQNYNSAFSYGSMQKKNKNGKNVISTPTLLSYADIFSSLFSSEKNLYDAFYKSELQNNDFSGLPLGIQNANIKDFLLQKRNYKNEKKVKPIINCKKNFFEVEKILQNEKSELEELKKLLCEKTELSESELKEKITELAKNKNYLFLHFPDGYEFSYNQSFLNRMRIELDFFLKILSDF